MKEGNSTERKSRNESQTIQDYRKWHNFWFLWPLLMLREDALEEIESCDIKCSIVGGWSGSRIHSLGYGQFGSMFTPPCFTFQPGLTSFLSFQNFHVMMHLTSKGLNFSQNVNVIRSRLWFGQAQPKLWPEARVAPPLLWASWSGMTNLANFPAFLINITFSLS